ncbi:MAG TPA: hypothetical protein VGI39_43785 [Polyangiaceae bacterium]|jgi:hypothetical protein
MAARKKAKADEPGTVVGMLAMLIKTETQAALRSRGRAQRLHLEEVLEAAEVLGGIGTLLNRGESIDLFAQAETKTTVRKTAPAAAKKARWPEDRVLAEARVLARKTVDAPDDESQKRLSKLLDRAGWTEEEFIAAVGRESASRRKKKR